MIIRTYALYEKNRKVLAFLSPLFCVGVGLGVVSAQSPPTFHFSPDIIAQWSGTGGQTNVTYTIACQPLSPVNG